MKKIFFSLAIFSFLFLAPKVLAGEQKTAYFFYGDGCPHCAKEEKFLTSLVKQYPDLKIEKFETWNNTGNSLLLEEIIKELGIKTFGVPIFFAGQNYIIGYQNDATSGAEIQAAIECYLSKNSCEDQVAPIIARLNNQATEAAEKQESCIASSETCETSSSTAVTSIFERKINIPFLGNFSINDFSLPALTAVFGFLDGFNPCAMWVLIFLISLLLGMKNRRKMWILGFLFIFVSGLVYFMFMAAWLHLFIRIGFIFWVRIAVAFVAIYSAFHHFKNYFKNKDGACEIMDSGKKKKVIEKMKNILSENNLWLAAVGIVFLSAGVNMVELFCSAGLPAIYTQVLSLSNLPAWKYYFYMSGYILFYMLDDVIIFIIAMITLKLKPTTAKYTRSANLIGGIIMLIIGILLIFKPGWLMFG
jgi:thiol-disulfide isomerase/thioredoxin